MGYRLPIRILAGILGGLAALGSVAGIWMLAFAPGLRLAGICVAIGSSITAYVFLYAARTGFDVPFDEDAQE